MPRKGTVLSEAAAARQREAEKKWHAENYERFCIAARKGKREAYNRLARLRGVSLSALIQDYLDGECKKEGIEI